MKKFLATALSLASLCLGHAALAQQGTSRLDEVIKAGKLRVCTPGDYRPMVSSASPTPERIWI